MSRFIAKLSPIFVALAIAQAHLLPFNQPANNATLALATRDVDPSLYNDARYKDIKTQVWADPASCEHPYLHVVHPNAPRAVNTVDVFSCRDNPVIVENWSFTIIDTCVDDMQWVWVQRVENYDGSFGNKQVMADGKLHDVILKISLEVCIKALPSPPQQPSPSQQPSPPVQPSPPEQPPPLGKFVPGERDAEGNVNPHIFDSHQYKELVPIVDLTGEGATCHDNWHIHDVKPNVPHAVDKISVWSCNPRPVVVDQYTFHTVDQCSDVDIMNPIIESATWIGTFGDETRDVGGQVHDVLRTLNVSVCVRARGDAVCWGEWIPKPQWDYEWQIHVPWDAIYDKYECGHRFEEEIRAACGSYEQTKFECTVRAPGADIRVRHSLLCGRSKIMDGIRKASEDGLKDLRCPYFVEVPVPPN